MEVNATLLIQLFLFLSLLGWLSKFLFSPMQKLFEERERRIQGARAEALELQKQAADRLAEVDARIHAAQKDAKLALLALQAEGVRFHREVLEAARLQSAEQMRLAHENLKAEIDKIRAELAPTETDLSNQILNRFLGNSKTAQTMEHTHA
ncbi:MAG: ATP synthase F0 subunit B [Myxococcaceae bacterium]